MAWVYLLIAGLLEIVWAVAMKYSEGFSKTLPTTLTFGAGLTSFWFLSFAVDSLPVGTAYAIWTGIGAIGTALLGMILFKEPATVSRLLCIVLIVAGIAGLRWTAAP